MKKISIITSVLLCVAISAVAENALNTEPNEAITATTEEAPDSTVIRTLLQTIYFERNSVILSPSSLESLDSIIALFKQNTELRYEIQGHSDSITDTKYNEFLPGLRAITVKNYIISKGIPIENIVAVSYSATKPISPDSTSSGRALNRRVEIMLIESVPVLKPEPEPIIQIAEPKPCPIIECETCPDIQSAPKQKSRASIGIGGFFSNDFGGGFKMPEINIKNIKIPGTEMKTPWIGGGVKGFFDITYAEFGIGLTFASGDWSFNALNLGLLGKYPIELHDNISMFPAAGIDYQLELNGDYSALWFKFGTGMDIAVNDAIFIRPMLLYGFRQANKWENDAVRPVIQDGKEGTTLLGHGITFSVGIGFKL